MRNDSLGLTFALSIVLTIALSWPAAASAQSAQQSNTANGTTPEKTPDFYGIWMQDRPPATSDQYWVYELRPEEPPMTAWGLAKFKANRSSFGPHPFPIQQTNDPVYKSCTPPGVPRIYAHPFPVQIIQVPGEVIMLFEYDSMRRQIFTDGRAHDTSLGPSWMGDAVGHWEKDTLVVDTVNFNDKTWIDRAGHPHSDQLHVVERMRRINHDHLLDDITIEDPKAYSKPWTAHLDFLLKPTWTMAEQFCEDNQTFLEVEKKETAGGK